MARKKEDTRTLDYGSYSKTNINQTQLSGWRTVFQGVAQRLTPCLLGLFLAKGGIMITPRTRTLSRAITII